MEELLKLESDDTSASRDVANKIHSRLKGARDPSLLGELVEFYFQTYSKRARKILTTLRETHSQDFFNKLDSSIWTQKILPVFKLLAHALNSQQSSWLYRIVDHPLFSSILQQLEKSQDVMVLSMGVLVVAAILPLVPTYIGTHLQKLFSIFCELATIRTTKRLGFTPNELVLHLDVSVYYLFLQLYALFPCNLFSFFKNYCETSPRAQVQAFQEFIAPLFYQVQLHPGLVTDSCVYELSKAKWGAMEPSDIATLSLQFCLDSHLSSSITGTAKQDSQHGKCLNHYESSTPATRPLTLSIPPITAPPRGVANCISSNQSDNPLITANSGDASTEDSTFTNFPPTNQPRPTLVDAAPLPSSTLDPLNPGGLKTSEELSQFWSPSISLGQISTPLSQTHSETASYRSGRNSTSHLSQPATNISSPNSDSALSSALHTPAPSSGLHPSAGSMVGSLAFTYKNYSPTASVDGESIFSRQALSQSAVHTPLRLEESLNSEQMEPLCHGQLDPASSHAAVTTRGVSSLRNKLGRFFGVFKKDEVDGATEFSEDYIELFVNDANHQKAKMEGEFGLFSGRTDAESRREISERVEDEEVGVECTVQTANDIGDHNVPPIDIETPDSPVNSHRQPSMEGQRHLDMDKIEIDISNLPLSNRVSRSDSESSQTSVHHFDYGDANNSPNPAGTGCFDHKAALSYKADGASVMGSSVHRMSSSYPRRNISRLLGSERIRTHTSNSETEISHHAHQLQERLRKLIEKEPGDSVERSEEENALDSCTPVAECPHHYTVDTPCPNTSTLHCHSIHKPGVMMMRRVSVCSRKGLGNQFAGESSGDGTAIVSNQGNDDHHKYVSLVSSHPSPLALLDQFVSCGEVLHRGGINSIPLTEQEGVDWNHFGGCPHTEEFRVMQSQVVLLHSQLLFERHQCIQHAKRNRRLLSKARSTAHITEELVSLGYKLRQQEDLVTSLRQQLQRVSEAQGSEQQSQHQEENCLARENLILKDNNARLEEELWRIKERNKVLEEEEKRSKQEIFRLTSKHQQLEPRLQQADQLQSEISSLSREFQHLGELYRQQQEETLSLRSQHRQWWEWKVKCGVLQRERDDALRKVQGLVQTMEACQGQLKELEEDKSRKEAELEKLQIQLKEERGHAWNKIQAQEDKYRSMKVIGQQLESYIMELKGRPVLQHKRTQCNKHHNTSSINSSPPSPPRGLEHNL